MADSDNQPQDEKYDYYAFISYSHKDLKWAKWLQHKLESFTIPSSIQRESGLVKKNLRPVFRDQTDMSGGVIKENLAKELSLSQFLIVICSQNSANSSWVNDEVEHFIKLGRYKKIIPFIVDSDSSDINNCFPPALRKNTDAQLLGVSVNELGKKNAILRIIANLLGVKFDTIKKRHNQRTRKRILIWASIFLALCLGFGIYYSHVNRIVQEQQQVIDVETLNNKLDEIRTLINNGERVLALDQTLSLYKTQTGLSESDKEKLYSFFIESNYIPAFGSVNKFDIEKDEKLISYWLRSDPEHPALGYLDLSEGNPVLKYVTVFDKFLTTSKNYEISNEHGLPLGIQINLDDTITPLYKEDVAELTFGKNQSYYNLADSALFPTDPIEVKDGAIFYNGVYQTSFDELSKYGYTEEYKQYIQNLNNGSFALYYSDPGSSYQDRYDPFTSGGVIIVNSLTGQIIDVPIPAPDAENMFNYDKVFSNSDNSIIFVVQRRGIYEVKITPYFSATGEALESVDFQNTSVGDPLVSDQWLLYSCSLADGGTKIYASNAHVAPVNRLPDYGAIELDSFVESYTAIGNLLYISTDTGVSLFTLENISLNSTKSSDFEISYEDALQNALFEENTNRSYKEGHTVEVNSMLSLVLNGQMHYMDESNYSGVDICISLIDKDERILTKFVARSGWDIFYIADKNIFGFFNSDDSKVVEAFRIYKLEDWPER